MATSRTLLSRFMLVEPYALLNEAAALTRFGVTDALDRISIDPACVVITPAHRAANRLRERARGAAAHGTCGLGFGEAVADGLEHPELTLRAGELSDPGTVARKLAAVVASRAALATDGSADADALRRPDWIDEAVELYASFAERIRVEDGTAVLQRSAGPVVFEGGQGVLLDQTHGFHPHTTWSTTTFANAERLAAGAGLRRPRRIGVLRSYFTRHGAGPLVTEAPALRAALPEPHNGDAGPQGRFRVGPFDAVAARYALAVAGGVDELAVTHMDRLPDLPRRICTGYETAAGWCLRDLPIGPDLTTLLSGCRPSYEVAATDDPAAFADRLASEVGAPVGQLSFGPTAGDKRRHR